MRRAEYTHSQSRYPIHCMQVTITRTQDPLGILYTDFVKSGGLGTTYLTQSGYVLTVNSAASVSCMPGIGFPIAYQTYVGRAGFTPRVTPAANALAFLSLHKANI